MFNNISWQSYWIVIALSSIAYYSFIFLKYFKKDIVFKHRNADTREPNFQIREDHTHKQAAFFDAEDHGFQQPTVSHEQIVHSCMDELTAFFEQSKRSKIVKQELIYCLQGILRKYPIAKTSYYKDSLSKVIIVQCENIYSIHLSADDVAHMWAGS